MSAFTTISVSEILGITIHTRQAARVLIEKMATASCRVVNLDFNDVNFVSRSFADELYLNLKKLKETTKKDLRIFNLHDEVRIAFEAVRDSHKESKENKTYSIPVHHYTSRRDFFTILLS